MEHFMTVRLVILGLLRERPLYGYEIKQIIEEHMSNWTSIAFGSIYFALDKLAEEKFVEKVEIEQQGKRPSRSVYQIMDAGREEFLRLLRESWQQFEREYYPLDICLFFLDSLPLKEVP
jgi:DNA-binding PadR family transcriptional regulator